MAPFVVCVPVDPAVVNILDFDLDFVFVFGFIDECKDEDNIYGFEEVLDDDDVSDDDDDDVNDEEIDVDEIDEHTICDKFMKNNITCNKNHPFIVIFLFNLLDLFS